METGTDLAIVGGGAAGLVAAIAARDGAEGDSPRVLVLEAAREVGRKILISGGGRCNVLPMEDARERFVSSSPRRLVSRFLDRFPLDEQRAFFEDLLGGPLREEPESKKLFPPSNRAKDVRDALKLRAERDGAVLRCATPVRGVTRAPVGVGFRIELEGGESVEARAVILTTGGLSVLGGGADAKGLDWAMALGHSVRTPYPALAPLVGSDPAHHALSGVSVIARVTARSGAEGGTENAGREDLKASVAGGFLFTHKGWSGPAVLDVSHVVERAGMSGGRAEVSVCFSEGSKEAAKEGTREGPKEHLASKGPERAASGSRIGAASASASASHSAPGSAPSRSTSLPPLALPPSPAEAAMRWDEALRTGGPGAGGGSLSSFLRKKIPDRLVSLLLVSAGVAEDISLSRLTRLDRARVVSALTEFPLPVTGTEGYRTAEVMGGGVELEEVDPGSGASRLVPGLFFAGEILDAFGPIGGFNFQWAWATGRTAGGAAAKLLRE